LPLAILGNYKESGGLFFYLWAIGKAKFNLFFGSRKNYPEVIVLEYGADQPGDIKKLVGITEPDVGVVTAVGEVPVHIEFYNSADAIAEEKSSLINNLGPTKKAVLNIEETIDLIKKAEVSEEGYKSIQFKLLGEELTCCLRSNPMMKSELWDRWVIIFPFHAK